MRLVTKDLKRLGWWQRKVLRFAPSPFGGEREILFTKSKHRAALLLFRAAQPVILPHHFLSFAFHSCS